MIQLTEFPNPNKIFKFSNLTQLDSFSNLTKLSLFYEFNKINNLLIANSDEFYNLSKLINFSKLKKKWNIFADFMNYKQKMEGKSGKFFWKYLKNWGETREKVEVNVELKVGENLREKLRKNCI